MSQPRDSGDDEEGLSREEVSRGDTGSGGESMTNMNGASENFAGRPKRSDQTGCIDALKVMASSCAKPTAVLACRTRPSLVLIAAQCILHGIHSLN
jgi:hypothetical protein